MTSEKNAIVCVNGWCNIYKKRTVPVEFSMYCVTSRSRHLDLLYQRYLRFLPVTWQKSLQSLPNWTVQDSGCFSIMGTVDIQYFLAYLKHSCETYCKSLVTESKPQPAKYGQVRGKEKTREKKRNLTFPFASIRVTDFWTAPKQCAWLQLSSPLVCRLVVVP